MSKIHNINISQVLPLVSPGELKKKYPVTDACSKAVFEGREVIKNILKRKDKRMLAIVGPCSIHDTKASFAYAERLKACHDKYKDRLYILMRTYFEKPRTTIGWKGMIADPNLDGSYKISEGLEIARNFLLRVTGIGLPCGSELLDPLVPQYIGDLISWASIGARTIESQTHREMASGLSMPIGLKNATSGDVSIAINGMVSARHPHNFIGINQAGSSAIYKTTGNKDSHIILRGGKDSPNYYEESVEKVEYMILKMGIKPNIIVDCSHANSSKDFNRQKRVLSSIMDQKKRNNCSLIGFMIESNLKEGSQSIPLDLKDLKYGQSITDACVGWETTEEMLAEAYEGLA